MTYFVTTHAVERYAERVEPVTAEVALERIHAHWRAINSAVAFGCRSVRIGCGARLILDGPRVVTVLGRGQHDKGQFHDLEKRKSLRSVA